MSHVMSYVTRKSPSCTGDTAACILVVDRICSLSMVIASAVQIGLNCCRRQDCPRHLLTMFFDRRLEFYRRQICQRRQKCGVSQGQCLAPTSSATTVAMQTLFMSIMGSVSSSRSRPQGMWDLQCQPGPGHGIICKRICCSRFHTRGKAPTNSRDSCIDGY